MVKYGLLHCHTQNSIRDSVMTVGHLCKRAKELGAPAVAISDHGVLTGTPSFLKAAKENNIKPVVGIELYVKEHEYDERLHLIVYAKDKIGYQAMMKAVKLSNKRIEKVKTLIFPLANREILETCFGPGSEGYGHVIATSACVGGVLAGLNFQNRKYESQIEVLSAQVKEYQEIFDLLDSHKKTLETLESAISEILPVSEKKYGMAKKKASKIVDEAEKMSALAKLAEEENETELAKKKLAQLKANRTAVNKQVTLCKNKLPKDRAIIEQRMSRLKELKSQVRNKEELISLMQSEAVRYSELFGKDNFYIELQFHGIPEEKEFMYVLDNIAQKLNIPTVAANDAHMAGNTKEDIIGRETITSLRFTKFEALEKTDYELYLKNDEELENALTLVVTPSRAKLAMENVGKIVEACNYVPDENPKHYPVFDKTQDSFELLKKFAYEGISKRFPNGFPTDEYQKRLDYELEVIKKMNVSDYHLIVQDLINFGKKLGKMPEERFNYLSEHIWEMSFEEIVEYVNADQSYVGYTVGPGRGSSAGSLVCYLIGITDLDPIKYNLLFERYLNPERITMPKQYWAFNVNTIAQWCA